MSFLGLTQVLDIAIFELLEVHWFSKYEKRNMLDLRLYKFDGFERICDEFVQTVVEGFYLYVDEKLILPHLYLLHNIIILPELTTNHY